MSEGVSKVSKRANERTDERVAQYLSLYSWLFWTIVHPPFLIPTILCIHTPSYHDRDAVAEPRRPAEEKDAQFRHKLLTFISRKADMIFKPVRDVDQLRAARVSSSERADS